MRIVEGGPEEEGLAILARPVDVRDGALGDPGVVVEALGEVPGSGVAGSHLRRRPRPAVRPSHAAMTRPGAHAGLGWWVRAEVVAPAGEAILLHPDGVVGADGGFVG